METNSSFLKLLKAKISQKYYEEYEKIVKGGLEASDSIFNAADFNDDGKVDEEDKNLFEEYIKEYSFNDMPQKDEDYSSIREVLDVKLDADMDGNGVVSDDEKEFLEYIQNAMELYVENLDDNAKQDILKGNIENIDTDDFADWVTENENITKETTETDKDENEVSEEKIMQLNSLKEECLAIQKTMQEAKEKYDQAKRNSKFSENRQDNIKIKSTQAQLRYQKASNNYDEIYRKKMKNNSKRTKNGNASNKNPYDDQLKEARKARESARSNMTKVEIEYGMAGSDVAMYESMASTNMLKYSETEELFNSKVEEFNSLYETLNSAELAFFGENPFIAQ